jgi:hypothetical protein
VSSAGGPATSPLNQLYQGARIIKGLVAFLVILFITCIVGASQLRGPTSSFFLNMFVVGATVVAAFFGVIAVARRIRTRRGLGRRSNIRIYPEDVLMAGASALGGVLALSWIIIELAQGKKSDTLVDLLAFGLGLLLLWSPIREFRAYTRGEPQL